MLAFLQSPAFTIPRAFFYPGCQKVFFCREAAIVRGKCMIEILAIERSLQDVNCGFAAHNHSFALLCFFWLPEKYLSCRLTVSALFGFKILVELAFALHQEMKCKNTNIVSLSGVDTGF